MCFVKQKTAYEMRISDWSSDVCSSELGGLVEVLDVDDGLLRIDDAEVHYRIDLDRHVVARDHVLLRHVHDNRAQVDPHHLLHHGNQDDQARALHLPVAAELEHHSALVFAQHLDCTDQQYEQQQDRKSTRLNSSH